MTREPLPTHQVTARLVLRPWRPTDRRDCTAALEIYSHPQVWPWLGAPPQPCADLAAARARLDRWAGLADGVRGVWALVPFGGPDIPVGSALLLALPRSDGTGSDAVEVGWHLHPSWWGRGLATEAARATLVRAFAAGRAQVHAVVYPENARSLAVCDRLGMQRLWLTPEWYGTLTVDHVVASHP